MFLILHRWHYWRRLIRRLVTIHQQVLFAIHIRLGNQRRFASLSAALKGKVGPIRATVIWLP